MHKELKKKLNKKDTKVGRLNNRMSGDVTHWEGNDYWRSMLWVMYVSKVCLENVKLENL